VAEAKIHSFRSKPISWFQVRKLCIILVRGYLLGTMRGWDMYLGMGESQQYIHQQRTWRRSINFLPPSFYQQTQPKNKVTTYNILVIMSPISVNGSGAHDSSDQEKGEVTQLERTTTDNAIYDEKDGARVAGERVPASQTCQFHR
jgi:hypothetical protein